MNGLRDFMVGEGSRVNMHWMVSTHTHIHTHTQTHTHTHTHTHVVFLCGTRLTHTHTLRADV